MLSVPETVAELDATNVNVSSSRRVTVTFLAATPSPDIIFRLAVCDVV